MAERKPPLILLGSQAGTGRSTKLEGMASFAELVNVWSRRLERIAGEFAAGHAQVAPTNKACNSCHLQGLCRVPAALEEADELHE